MEVMKKDKVSAAYLYVSLLAFIAFAVYILFVNQAVLYTAHDRSEFIFGAPFFHTLLSKPFGLMQYVGAWLTQFFYYPALGAGILLAIWILIFWVGAKAFRLKGIVSALMLLPVACLLTSVTDLGYWIYIFSVRGYWFSQSVGYLVMLLLLWAAQSTPRKWHLVWYLIAFCIYPVLGWFALLFLLCLVLSGKLTWREIVGVILLIATAIIWHTLLYSNQKLEDITLAGMPRFVTPLDSSTFLTIPFWVLGAVSVIIAWGGSYLVKAGAKVRRFVPVLCAAAGVIFVLSFMFHDRNYIDEMRMMRLAENNNWQEVLHVAEENKQPSHTMVMLKNIALMNEGGLLERSFKMGNHGIDISNPDSLHIGLLNIAAPLVYYNYGKMNYAIRLCYENAVTTGFSPFYMKMISRCARATGEEKLVERFTTLLHHNMFYANWQPAPITKTVSELQKSFVDEINGVDNNSEQYIIDNFSLASDSVSKAVAEQALFYSMIRRDSGRFWASLRRYVKLNPNGAFPLHAQEAYIMFMDKAPEEKKMMLPVEQAVFDRYKQFWQALENKVKPGVDLQTVGEEMRDEWGDTYWWYNIFGMNAH